MERTDNRPTQAMAQDCIIVRGAHEHNLRHVDVALPRYRLNVLTGVSGSGKSSLAFDTIFKEGQRRYLESLSAYARQFLGQMEKPRVDHIEGLSPTVAIDQKTTSRNPRSTVGTITEVYDFLRVLFARAGTPHCPRCGREVTPQPPDTIIRHIMSLLPGTRLQLLAPVIRDRKGEHRELLATLRAQGYVRARIDGEIRSLDEKIELSRYKRHTIEVVVDRLVVDEEQRQRVADSVETALELGKGLVIVLTDAGEQLFSRYGGCPDCGIHLPELEPRMFSFNSPHGACPRCKGLGKLMEIDPDLVVPDKTKSIRQGAIATTTSTGYTLYSRLGPQGWESLARAFGFSLDVPWQELSEEHRRLILYGAGRRKFEYRWSWQSQDGKAKGEGVELRRWEGIIPALRQAYEQSGSELIEQFMSFRTCEACGGSRLRPESLSVTFHGKSIVDVARMAVDECLAWVNSLQLSEREAAVAAPLLREIRMRLGFLCDVGLTYLTLDRSADSLSGGEAQRLRLASQLGSGLEGVLYVLDEPSIGLHHRDNGRLLRTLARLRDRGNTVLVVEHDEETIRAADYVVDVGPGAGREGGAVVATGRASDIAATPESITGQYLSGVRRIPIPEKRRSGTGQVLRIVGARANNLQNITVEIPLGCFVCVTGVSGSGKSTLVDEVLKKALAQRLHGAKDRPGEHDRIEGIEHIDKVIEIDQSPIGRTPRSNPATYIGVFDHIRALFAKLPEARVRGYKPGRFSFNVKGGRCEACGGGGTRVVEMQFLAPVEVPCEVCGGLRYNNETLKVKYKGKTISDVLQMSAAEALEFFANVPVIRRYLQTLVDVGLGYMQLGQSSTTLSGGEAQRIKLAEQLARPATGRTLYILDEPTTGLHFLDVHRLLDVLQRLVDRGNTVLVVEHNPDVIKVADWIIDLGPEGGAAGGRVVATGTPEQVAQVEQSHTGQLLKQILFGGGPALSIAPGELQADGLPRRRLLQVRGARKHNLKGIDVEIPKNALTVVTGVSGSGKSTLALDTIFAEGQRRFVECLSSYARQFLGRPDDAAVERIEGLAPAIAIDQKYAARSPRSTVATATEIYDYLRLLFARLGRPHCPECDAPLAGLTSSQIVEAIMALPLGGAPVAPPQPPAVSVNGHAHGEHAGAEAVRRVAEAAAVYETAPPMRVQLLAPVERGLAGDCRELFRQLVREGFVRVRADGRIIDITEPNVGLDPTREHDIDVVVDRLTIEPESRGRLADSVELALARGDGVLYVLLPDGRQLAFSQRPACPNGHMVLDHELVPRLFSPNYHAGACEECKGLGVVRTLDPALVVPDPERSCYDGAIALLDRRELERGWWANQIKSVARSFGIDLACPWKDLPEEHRRILLWGSGGRTYLLRKEGRGRDYQYEVEKEREWKGIIPMFMGWYHQTKNQRWQQWLEGFMRELPCPACDGEKLRPLYRAVRFCGKTIGDIGRMTVREAYEFFSNLPLTPTEQQIAEQALREVRHRLQFLINVGLDYLTLNRLTSTLSGGEAQRIRLATQVGMKLVDALYVLDEPSIGLHQRDVGRLLATLRELVSLGNTVIVIEHDEETMRAADYLIDLGPGAGRQGGRVVATGTFEDILQSSASLTGCYLRQRDRLIRRERRRGSGAWLTIRGARQHNLKTIDVAIPLGTLVAVTGVSGSGKSTLVSDVLAQALAMHLHGANVTPGAHDRLEGIEHLSKVIVVDQSPIGRSPKSNPATYTGLFDHIRALFAQLPEARVRGYDKSRFSFNDPKGQCHHCEGNGVIRIEMHFLADVEVPCDHCGGKRYNPETLAVKYKGKSIADVLAMTVEQAEEFFAHVPPAHAILRTLREVGLGYMQLGQSSTTLSGGEAQRLKLATELCRPSSGRTLYILDEPTVGLHFADIERLLAILHRLVDAGNTVLVVEHNLDVIASADYVIDLGPEGGDAGGYLVACGTPEEVARCEESHTGRYLRQKLGLPAAPAGAGQPRSVLAGTERDKGQ